MSIHEAINDIAVDQGGTASTDGTIIGAIDALTDALAGSDQERAESIEAAVELLGEYIGSGGDLPEYGSFSTIYFNLHDTTSDTDQAGNARAVIYPSAESDPGFPLVEVARMTMEIASGAYVGISAIDFTSVSGSATVIDFLSDADDLSDATVVEQVETSFDSETHSLWFTVPDVGEVQEDHVRVVLVAFNGTGTLH